MMYPGQVGRPASSAPTTATSQHFADSWQSQVNRPASWRMIPYIVVLSDGSFTVQYHHAQSPLILSLQELYLLVPPRSGSEGLILSQGIRKYVASCEAQHTEDPRFPPSLQADVHILAGHRGIFFGDVRGF